MAEGSDRFVEQLLRETAAETGLSSPLRRRVIGAAETACRRRRWKRRLLCVGWLCLPLLAGTAAWNPRRGERPVGTATAVTNPRSAVSVDADAAGASGLRNARVGLAGPLEWQLVDAMVQRQEDNSAAIRAALQ